MASWVYILRCADGSYYTGCTTDLDSRIGQHRAGAFGGYTSTRLPVEVVWCAEFQDLHDAIDFERKVKRWSRAKKESFIEGDWTRLRARVPQPVRGCAWFETRSCRALLTMTHF